MSKQKHDLGNKKRRAAPVAPTANRASMEALAASLVARGLATPRILDRATNTGRRLMEDDSDVLSHG